MSSPKPRGALRSTPVGARAILAGIGAGSLVGLLLGLGDGAAVAARLSRFGGAEGVGSDLYLHTLSMVTLPCLGVGLLAGLFWALVPLDPGPIGLARSLWRLLCETGVSGAERAARGWSALLSMGLGAALLVPLCLHFLTAYHNHLLAALTLTVCIFGVLGLLAMMHITLRHHLGRWLPRAVAHVPGLAWLLGPQAIAGLSALALIAVAVLVPSRYQETWEALPLRSPLWVALALLALWVGTDLLVRLGWRSLLALGLPSMACAAVVLGLSFVSFGNGAGDRRIAVAMARHAPLSGMVLRRVARLFDRDGDGFPGRFGGGDCDDGRARINPGAVEIPDNGVDEDCSGDDLHLDSRLLTAVRPRPAPTPSAPKARLRRRWNVLLVLIDALRADRMGWAGNRRGLTPNLDRLARRSAAFLRAYSPSNRTAAVVPALLTGRYTSELDRTGGHFIAIYNANVTLAERLEEAGYATMASTSHFYMRPGYGLAQGFQVWRSYYERSSAKMERMPTSPHVTSSAISLVDRWLAAQKGRSPARRRPFFLFTYYFDPHKHYLEHPGTELLGNRPQDRYDGEIRYTDAHVGRLLAHLERKGLADETVVVVTADHGELFGEHGLRYHGRDLFEEEIHVPLLVHVPGVHARRVPEPVSLVDLPRTLLDLLGLRVPAELQGISLVSRLVSEGPLPERVIYTEMVKGPHNPSRRAILYGGHKLIHDPMGNTFRLFDIRRDPRETTNLYAPNNALSQRLRKLYATFLATQLRPRRPSR